MTFDGVIYLLNAFDYFLSKLTLEHYSSLLTTLNERDMERDLESQMELIRKNCLLTPSGVGLPSRYVKSGRFVSGPSAFGFAGNPRSFLQS